MNKYSRTSSERLATTHPLLQLFFTFLLQKWNHSILCGGRGKEEQNAAWESGNSSLKWPHSKHNSAPSMAIDVAPWLPGVPTYNSINCAYFGGYVMSEAERFDIPLRYGGDFNGDHNTADQKLRDLVHYELRCSIEEADKIYTNLLKNKFL